MLKKNQPVKFVRPMSTMRMVLGLIEQGHELRADIVRASGLPAGKVISALYNLKFIDTIYTARDAQGRTVYRSPLRHYGVAPCLRGARSIFDVR